MPEKIMWLLLLAVSVAVGVGVAANEKNSQDAKANQTTTTINTGWHGRWQPHSHAHQHQHQHRKEAAALSAHNQAKVAKLAAQSQRALHSPAFATTSKPTIHGVGGRRLTLKTTNELDDAYDDSNNNSNSNNNNNNEDDDDVYNEAEAEADDYYEDEADDSSSVSIDVDIDYAAPIAPSAALGRRSHANKAGLAHDKRSYKRVPRDPQHLWPGHNRLDAHNAFDEDYQADQPGVLTARKEQELGTAEGAKKAFKHYQAEEMQTALNQNELRKMAIEHLKRVDFETRCNWPRPRVVYITNETSKSYSPRATVLHRCSEDGGCCADNSQICTAKSKEYVQLAFMERSQVGRQSNFKAVMLSLVNHTECECVDHSAVRRKRRNLATQLAPLTVHHRCHCPKHFSSFGRDDGSGCRCDCHLNDPSCQQLKNGVEGFAMSDRRCISTRDCSAPICSYGVYNHHRGRCPSAAPHHPQHPRHHHGFG